MASLDCQAAAIEYAGKGIRINAIAPGLVETSMTKHWFDDRIFAAIFWLIRPSAESHQPEEIAGAGSISLFSISHHLLSVKPS